MWKERVASELARFRSTSGNPRLQPDPAVLSEIVKRLKAFWDRCEEFGITDDFARTMTRHFIECWRELDALPRDDPFWDGTNRRPTILKLGDFCEKIRNDRPSDPAFRKMTVARDVVIGMAFHAPPWKSLREAGGLDDSWPVYAALLGLEGGMETDVDLPEFLKEIGPSEPALSALNRLTRSETPWIAGWAERVIAGWFGSDPHSCSAGG